MPIREVGGLYDHASELYEHFRGAAPKGVKIAKVHKVLHLMRPGMFPILDSRLAELYRTSARDAASKLRDCRLDLPLSRHAYWAAIRRDLLEALPAIEVIRRVFRESGHDVVARAVAELTDLRILDMLAWQAGGRPGG